MHIVEPDRGKTVETSNSTMSIGLDINQMLKAPNLVEIDEDNTNRGNKYNNGRSPLKL
ncbi:5680_t:CDS:1, partial [Racocetra fulgida]